MKKILIVSAAVMAAMAVSACGKMGELQPPGATDTNRSSASRWTDRNADPATVNRPISELPIEGVSDPLGRRPKL